jgi:glucan-binding YG repeat protein
MNRNNKWILAAIPFISLLMIDASYAQAFYKWVDDKGATHYTQTPPPQKSAQKAVEKIAVSKRIPQDSAKEIKSLDEQAQKNLNATTEQEKAADTAKETAKAEAERRNRNSVACEQLKTNQAQLQSGQRLRSVDANGQRTYLTEDQKAAQMTQIAAQIKSDCP